MDSLALTTYAIGAPFPLPELALGTNYNFTINGHHFVFVVERPSKVETRLFRDGPARVTFTREGPVLFVIVDFGDGFVAEATYDWWRNPPQYRPDLNAPSNILQLSLVDSATGQLASMRMLGLRDAEIIAALRDISSRQPAPTETEKIVQDVYRRCCSPDSTRLCTKVVLDQRFAGRRP